MGMKLIKLSEGIEYSFKYCYSCKRTDKSTLFMLPTWSRRQKFRMPFEMVASGDTVFYGRGRMCLCQT